MPRFLCSFTLLSWLLNTVHFFLLQVDSPVIVGLCNSSHRTGAYRHEQSGNCMYEFVNMAFWPH